MNLYEVIAPSLEKIPERLKAFMKDFYDNTQGHPFTNKIRLYGYVGLEVKNCWDQEAHLSSIMSFDKKGDGQASKALKFLTDLADKHQVPLTLTVQPIKNAGAKGKNLSAKSLKAWYERNGFTGSAVNMIRKPKNV